MTIISQAYVHLTPYDIDRSSLDKLGHFAIEISRQTAERLFEFRTSAEIVLAPGSLRGWITITAATAILQGVATYKDLKDSTKEIYADSQWFAQQVNEKLIQKSGAEPRQVFRKERRTKAIGRLSRLIGSLDEMERRFRQNGVPPTSEELIAIEREFALLEKEMAPEELEQVKRAMQSTDGPYRVPEDSNGRPAILPSIPALLRRRTSVPISRPSLPTYEIRGSLPTATILSGKSIASRSWDHLETEEKIHMGKGLSEPFVATVQIVGRKSEVPFQG